MVGQHDDLILSSNTHAFKQLNKTKRQRSFFPNSCIHIFFRHQAAYIENQFNASGALRHVADVLQESHPQHGRHGPQLAHGERRDALVLAHPHIGMVIEIDPPHVDHVASELELTVQCRQTNNEGEFVKWCHDAYDTVDAIVVNPAAWTHYAWAIHDALEPLTIPIVEVHLSNPEAREAYRRESKVAPACVAKVSGFGGDSYVLALEGLVRWLARRGGAA